MNKTVQTQRLTSSLILLLVLGACSHLPWQQKQTAQPPFVAPLGATGTPAPSPTPDPASFILLAPELTVKEGAYAFQPVTAWKATGEKLNLNTQGSMASMTSPDKGLYLNLNSEKSGVNRNSGDCLNMIRERMGASMQAFKATDPEQVLGNNIPGLTTNISGQLEGQPLSGKLGAYFLNQRCFSLIAFNYGTDADAQWQAAGRYAYAKLSASLRFLDQAQVASCQIAADSAYGLKADSPIRVGNTHIADGLAREELYLNTLRGPQFQPITFTRLDPLYNAAGEIVDAYQISYEGLAEPLTLYFDIYKFEPPLAPIGFSCEAPFPLSAP
ncbi:MAG: hypothetical protein VB108_07355 [Anaerolineaceae bacterium]|nr:hypothetical protein [Anaerolineaceae bacterium]